MASTVSTASSNPGTRASGPTQAARPPHHPAIPLLGLVTKHEHGMAATGIKATRRARQIRGDLGKLKEPLLNCLAYVT